MTFDELRALIAHSRPSEWQRIKKMGPTYRDRFGSWTGPGDQAGIDHDSHVEVAVYRPDIDLTIAYGMPESQHERNLTFKWSEAFPDSEIREISIADTFWRGSLVDRVNYVHVDGGRGIVPLGGGHQGLEISQHDLAVARLLSGIADYQEWDRYYGAVPFQLKD